ncbi:MAG: alanine dehydrogenase [Firmicutes bacterium]|nr:alanine dehydrogenase [Bacillota bacterium]
MIIGCTKEIKNNESRVAITPEQVELYAGEGHEVIIEKDAGTNAGFPDKEYRRVGAVIRDDMKEVYKEAQLIVKVKEILPPEYGLLRKDHIIFTNLHTALNCEETDVLLEKGCISFAAEDTHPQGTPNSEVAGKLGALMGVQQLLSTSGGPGKLIGGIAGVPGANVLVLGAGIVGVSALEVLVNLGANVTVADVDRPRLRAIKHVFPHGLNTMFSTPYNIRGCLPHVDLVVNAVKWPKERTDHLITREMLKLMKPKSIIVDISCDRAGAIETCEPTTHDNPTFEVEGVTHYCVDNIPGAVPWTASIAYAYAISARVLAIASKGVVEACRGDQCILNALTTYNGVLTHKETSIVQSRPYTPPEVALGLAG